MTTDSAGLQYVYSTWNLPVKVLNSAGTSTLETFENDGLGRRIAITIGSTTTNLYYSTQRQVLEESSGGDYTNRYIWNPANPNSLILRNSSSRSRANSSPVGSLQREQRCGRAGIKRQRGQASITPLSVPQPS